MKNTTQKTLGILMLDTRFPRIPGDVGNARTWPFQVRYGVVDGATPQAIVCDDMEPFVQAFVDKGRELIAQGCTGIATTCGFLALIRPRLVAALGVPVAASALEQAGQVLPMLAPDKRLGIVTISADSLSPAHLAAAGVPAQTPIQGMEGSSFARSILRNQTTLDVAAARIEMAAAASRLITEYPDVGAIILECTNMVPYAAEIGRVTGRPVFSVYSYLCWFQAGLAPAAFDAPSP
ncbi:aspartate/glutamate racemase family protein [Sulfitobacter sp. F26204]|uniref:aspartate/glutamate racemase family protein n=1 Tax=Sulfitobacter sp. F26204 TaxID=2996014 RepID=UPI00225E6589|nr:aspartate/glutamate racemase family protein [Sulfitobacter sp. F26204]MCX7558403.1 aspartate/glutamate racemase family protein [Sulfitobacter sp. F26204]